MYINSYKVHDIVVDRIDKEFDLILSRYTLQHLKSKDALSVIHNFISSNSKYLLMTNYPLNDVSINMREII